jgi:hypothetical protein
MKTTVAYLNRLLERIQCSAGSSWHATENGDLIHTAHITRDVWVFPATELLQELIDAKNAASNLDLGHLSLDEAIEDLNRIGLHAMNEASGLDAKLRELEGNIPFMERS